MSISMKALRGVFFTALATAAVMLPASSTDRVIHYTQQNPSSQQFNLEQRDQRLGFGQWVLNAMGNNTSGFYSNLMTTPSGGLFVQVAPTTPNSLGAVYQYLPDDTSPFGSGSFALSADPTQVYLQGLLSSPPIAVGPLTPPASAGQSINYLVECKVLTVDRTPTQYNFVNPSNNITQQTVNRDRADTVSCQAKSGSPAATPVTPTVDAGWVPLSAVTVANGTATIVAGNIVAVAPFTGFLTPGSPITVPSLPHGDYVDLTSNQVITGGLKTFNGGMTVNSNINGGGFGYVTGSSTYGPTGMTVNGNVNAQSGVFSGGVTAYSGASGGTIALTNNFFANFPTISNSSDNGMNFDVSTSSGLGYRYFKFDGSTTTQLGGLGINGQFDAYAGEFGGGSFSATVGKIVLGNDTSNGFLRNGTGALYFQNGNGSATYGNIGPTGLSVTGSINAGGIYNTIGTSSGNGVLSVPGTGILYLNYASGGPVQVGNGASGNSGLTFYNNGTMSTTGINDSGSISTASVAANGLGSFGSVSVAGQALVAGSGQGPTAALNVPNGDVYTARGNNSGAIFLGNGGNHYLFFDGTNYNLPGGNVLGGLVTSLNGVQGAPTITSPDKSVTVGTSGSNITISSPPLVPPTFQFGGSGLVTIGAGGEACTTVPYVILGATGTYSANTNNFAIYIIEVDQQTSNFGLGVVCFRVLNTSGTPIAGVGIYYNITTNHTLHG